MEFQPFKIPLAIAWAFGGVMLTYVLWEYVLAGDTSFFTIMEGIYPIPDLAVSVLWFIAIVVSLMVTIGVPAFILFEEKGD